MNSPFLRYTAIICSTLAGGLLLLTVPIKPRALSSETSSYATLLNITDPPLPEAVEIELPPPPPDIVAEAAVIYNPLKDEFLFQKNADEPFGIASITKIMTAIAALRRVGENDIVEIHRSAIETEGNEGTLVDGEHFILRNLIILMLASSSNDAATAIAEHVGFLQGASSFEESQSIFTGLMNETARDMGLGNTHFENPTGLDVDEIARVVSNVSTAKETSQLIGYALRYPFIYDMHATSETIVSEEGNVHVLSPTHKLLTNEPGIISGKTGFTDTAGGTLATVAEIPVGNLSVIIVLGSTRDNRFDDTLRLLDWLRTP